MGLIPVFARSGEPEWGHALETAVLIELERRGAEVTYVRTRDGLEVDFLARFPDGAAQLIQVTAALDDTDTREREIRGLVAARGEHRQADLILVSPRSRRACRRKST
jgi:predicted AAA+ superfamily ATPase